MNIILNDKSIKTFKREDRPKKWIVRVFLKIKVYTKWWWQRRTRGFDDRELWNLDYTIAKFALPRIIAFKEMKNGYPSVLTEQEWDVILSDMIRGFKYLIEDEYVGDSFKTESISMGVKLFGKHFHDLWD